ncbi:dihydrofolate reductase [Cryobacterium sp. MLB-32]|uniref:dihydrofolate reductase n=1 Tax=Cryobacterium sp. MLB-32 TaxID=1529318 RepID=UPI0004E6C94B|nr:dihydrofolate reductase [Cryobacterium sp. MLB-32]KFF59903.1 dihydrofolate reductase [Cryobacterium sp. MLB-32]
MTVTLVWAQSRNGLIGAGGVLPWSLPEDLARFRALTLGGAVLMGRKTWDALPDRFRPLPARLNIVLTRAPDLMPVGALSVTTLDDAFAAAEGREVWVIGGREVFDQAFERADVLEVTEINADVVGDTRAPEIRSGWSISRAHPEQGWHVSETGLEYRFLRYTRGPIAG